MNNFTAGAWSFPKSAPEPMTLAQAIDRYRAEVLVSLPKTATARVNDHLKQFEAWCVDREVYADNYRDWCIAMVSIIHIWIDSMVARGWSHATIHKAINNVGGLFRWLLKFGIIAQNPFRLIDHRRNQGWINPKGAITEEEYVLVRDAAAAYQGRYNIYGAIVCGWHTGLSLIDISLLKWSAIDLRNYSMSVVRTKIKSLKRTVVIPIIPYAELHLLLVEIRKAQPPEEQYVFPELASDQLLDCSPTVRKVMSRMFRKALTGRKTFHSLRHGFASRIANSGVNLAVAAKLTGISELSTLQGYIKPDMQGLRSAMEQAFPQPPPPNVIELKGHEVERTHPATSPQSDQPEQTHS